MEPIDHGEAGHPEFSDLLRTRLVHEARIRLRRLEVGSQILGTETILPIEYEELDDAPIEVLLQMVAPAIENIEPVKPTLTEGGPDVTKLTPAQRERARNLTAAL